VPYSSIQKQIALRLIPTLLILWVVSGGIILQLISSKTSDLLDSSLRETAERILPIALLDIEERAQINADIELVPLPISDENLSYQIQNRSNQVLLRSHKSPLDHIDNIAQGFSEQQGMRIYGSSTEDGSYKIYVFEPISHRKSTLYSLLTYFLIPFFLIIPISYGAIKKALRFLPDRLREYSNQLTSLTQGELHKIEPNKLPNELIEIGHSVNALIDRLNEILKNERAFSENVAHELRTPIAIAMAQLEVIMLDLDDQRSISRFNKIKTSLNNLNLMINKFLQIARAESGLSEDKTNVSLEEITRHIVDQLKSKSERNYQIISIEPIKSVLINPDALGIILMNLLENAHQYADKNTSIDILIGPNAQIRIQNQCEIIGQDEMPTIMERYQRGAQKGNGLGIGLSIVNLLLKHSNGNLLLQSPIPNQTYGVEATIEWTS
jgi:two-component system OmpR family sensor kinase